MTQIKTFLLSCNFVLSLQNFQISFCINTCYIINFSLENLLQILDLGVNLSISTQQFAEMTLNLSQGVALHCVFLFDLGEVFDVIQSFASKSPHLLVKGGKVTYRSRVAVSIIIQ